MEAMEEEDWLAPMRTSEIQGDLILCITVRKMLNESDHLGGHWHSVCKIAEGASPADRKHGILPELCLCYSLIIQDVEVVRNVSSVKRMGNSPTVDLGVFVGLSDRAC